LNFRPAALKLHVAMETMALVSGLLGVLGILVALAGAVVCALHLGRSKYVLVLLGGFVVEAAVGAAYVVVPMLMRTGLDPSGLMTVYSVLRMVGVGAQAAIVAGVAGLLIERRSEASGRAD
jgi:hypothetical protein